MKLSWLFLLSIVCSLPAPSIVSPTTISSTPEPIDIDAFIERIFNHAYLEKRAITVPDAVVEGYTKVYTDFLWNHFGSVLKGIKRSLNTNVIPSIKETAAKNVETMKDSMLDFATFGEHTVQKQAELVAQQVIAKEIVKSRSFRAMAGRFASRIKELILKMIAAVKNPMSIIDLNKSAKVLIDDIDKAKAVLPAQTNPFNRPFAHANGFRPLSRVGIPINGKITPAPRPVLAPVVVAPRVVARPANAVGPIKDLTLGRLASGLQNLPLSSVKGVLNANLMMASDMLDVSSKSVSASMANMPWKEGFSVMKAMEIGGTTVMETAALPGKMIGRSAEATRKTFRDALRVEPVPVVPAPVNEHVLLPGAFPIENVALHDVPIVQPAAAPISSLTLGKIASTAMNLPRASIGPIIQANTKIFNDAISIPQKMIDDSLNNMPWKSGFSFAKIGQIPFTAFKQTLQMPGKMIEHSVDATQSAISTAMI